MAAVLGSALCAIAIGYLSATTYLVLRDNLIGASIARQARMQQAYEDRIAALRAQVDRITSRQMLDQRIVEGKVSELLELQAKLSQRHGRIEPILGVVAPDDRKTVPLPVSRPDQRADAAGMQDGPKEVAHALWATRDSHSPFESAADRADRLFVAINQSLRSIESEQIEKVTTLAENAFETASAISEALAAAGLEVDTQYGERDVGGPLIAADPGAVFETRVKDLDMALGRLAEIKEAAARLPIHNPAPGRAVTSGFGVRKDPIIGASALHAGMDFRSRKGSPVFATGAGKVVKAGWNGGYGRMIEIEHADGFATRYAHLGRISVEVGDEIKPGQKIGASGNSGRSTGPHLHYEVRKDGKPLNPLRFLKAGKAVTKLM